MSLKDHKVVLKPSETFTNASSKDFAFYPAAIVDKLIEELKFKAYLPD